MNFPPNRTPWVADAACLDEDPDLFFPIKGSPDANDDAKRVCSTCSVRGDCLELAMTNNERDGVFGGLSYEERVNLRRRRQRTAA